MASMEQANSAVSPVNRQGGNQQSKAVFDERCQRCIEAHRDSLVARQAAAQRHSAVFSVLSHVGQKGE